ncbi:MAG: hypothetical protein J6S50_00400 [Oscillospiraceae bacterium]|nr:hypothetical protein [Kiritimatiellia bacterium]MBO7726889.1 hypothetical protein [Oscillospiraceae bacterium]MBO7726961.1 hypothetical protein [Oscillospiraceae bacterium]
MAWIEPKTNWVETDRCTFDDANRIASNINELLGSASLKADYTQDDVISAVQWRAVLDAIDSLIDREGYHADDLPGMSATALNFNIVEGLTLGIKEWIDLKNRQHAADIFFGEVYSGENQCMR